MCEPHKQESSPQPARNSFNKSLSANDAPEPVDATDNASEASADTEAIELDPPGPVYGAEPALDLGRSAKAGSEFAHIGSWAK